MPERNNVLIVLSGNTYVGCFSNIEDAQHFCDIKNESLEDFVRADEEYTCFVDTVDKLSIDENMATKTKDGVKIDLGGIVKGYACDLAGKILVDEGFSSGYISIGGSSIYILRTEELLVHHPRANEKMQNALCVNTSLLNNESVSSSGDYQRYYTVDGVRYSHLINPVTAKPTDTGVTGATVICNDGFFADAITTALCLYEYYPNEKSSPLTEFINKIISDYPTASIFVFYQKDGYNLLLTNKKQGEHFTLLDSNITVVNV